MKINSPVKNKIAKTPVIMQLEMLECGAASLTMILAYYSKWIPLEQVRIDCGVSRDGSSARNIVLAARNYGLDTHAYSIDVETLRKEGTFPLIVHWNFNHFVVVNGFKGKYAYLNDPARGDVKVTLEEFDEAFTGIAIEFAPTDKFVPEGHKKSVWDYISERSKGLVTIGIFVVLVSTIANLMNLIQPGFTRVLYDRLLTGINPEWENGFIIALAVLSALQIIILLIKTKYTNKINGKMAAVGSTSFMWKVLRLPMEFFSQRMSGDILARQTSNTTISNTIVNTLAPLVLETIMMFFYLIVMFRFNALLTAVGLFSMVVNFVVSQYISKKRMNATRVAVRDAGKLSAFTTSGIEMIETIKASGCEDGFFEKWSGYQSSSNNGNIAYSKTSVYLGLIPTIVSSLCSSIILAIGVYLTIKGEFTLGMITAFQGYLTGFLAPAQTLITAGQKLQEMQTEIERVDDVMMYNEDVVFDDSNVKDKDNYDKLSGAIEIKNVSFGYSPLDKPLIENFNLSVKPGQRIALVGESGCGKSTLSKLISGLVQPWSGEITFDGKKISEIDRNVFTGSVAVVDQDIIIFEDSINNNIKMWDETIEDFEVVLATRDAQIHSDIMERENGFNYSLTEGGKDFSGGQKQRLEIARVLAMDPTICILDEATSALDAKTEYDVVKAIKDRGITTIVIAHRLSTIRDCDEIIVLDHGKVVERGTHQELMKLNGYYTKLVTND